MNDVVDALKKNIEAISTYIVEDPTDEYAGKIKVPHRKLALMNLAYVTGKNVLLYGEPGFGKTTSAKVCLTLNGGLPFDTFESVQIQGHPEQTVETMAHRPDFGSLALGKESVVFMPALFFDGYLLDEINRLPPGKQDFTLNSIDTGRWTYLGRTLYFGKKPFFATYNYEDGGNHKVIPPLLDRFAISMELGRVPGGREPIKEARKKIENELYDTEMTTDILNELNNREISDADRRKIVTKYSMAFSKKLAGQGVRRVDDKFIEEFRKRLDEVKITPEANLYLDFIEGELNLTQLYGQKRRNDPVDRSSHAQALASACTKNSFSPRGMSTVEDFAKGLVLMLGDKEVRREHVHEVAPYAMAHRMEFDNDYASLYTEAPRHCQENSQMDLSRRLLAKMEAHFLGETEQDNTVLDKNQKTDPKKEKDPYRSVFKKSQLLDRFAGGLIDPKSMDLNEAEQKIAKEMLNYAKTEPERIDHPFVREMAQRIIRELKNNGVEI